jgi:tRNA(Ile)-lysidine synthase
VLPQLVAGTLSRYSMLPPGARVGVGVSGGADSVCLLHLLDRLAPRFEVVLHVLHLDHGLRGAESDADARFVREQASGLGLPCSVERWARPSGPGNLEEAARNARLDFFGRMMATHGLARVATGHTLSDQAETVLFRALRGSGPGGLAGILPVTAEGLVRPLIDASRAGIVAWLQAERLAWREDSSNGDQRFARNRLRRGILPDLAAAGHPGAERALARLASIVREEEEYWRPLVDAELANAGRGPLLLSVEALQEMPRALARRVVREAYRRAGGTLRGLHLDHVEEVLDLARGPRGCGAVSLPAVSVRRSLDWLRFCRPGPEPETGWSVILKGPGIANAGPLRLEVTEVQTLAGREAGVRDCLYNEGSHRIDAAAVSFPVELRNWRPGDCYQPVGRLRALKLKELFHEARVPSWNRQDWPMIVCRGRIVWSRKFGPAAWAAPGAGTGKALMVRELEGPAAGSDG